jgi:hypothetical protein
MRPWWGSPQHVHFNHQAALRTLCWNICLAQTFRRISPSRNRNFKTKVKTETFFIYLKPNLISDIEEANLAVKIQVCIREVLGSNPLFLQFRGVNVFVVAEIVHDRLTTISFPSSSPSIMLWIEAICCKIYELLKMPRNKEIVWKNGK